MSLRASPNSRRTAASSAWSSSSTTDSQRSASRSCSPALTWPMVWVAKTRPPPGLSRIEPAISSWPRAHLTISSPGCVSSGLGLSTSIPRLLSGKAVERITGEPVHGPLGVRFGAELLVEADRVDVPVQHRPLEAAAVALHRDLGELDQQRFADALAAVRLRHVEVLEVQPGLGQERRVVVKEEREPDRLSVVFGEQRLRV